MKIKETIERSCCRHDDLQSYNGEMVKGFRVEDKLKFCQHCGQLWYWVRSPGEMDYGYEKVKYE